MTNRSKTLLMASSTATLCLIATLSACSESTPAAATDTTGSGGTSNGSAGSGGAPVVDGPGVWATINVELIAQVDAVVAHANLGAFAKDSAPVPDPFAVTKTVGDCKLLEPTKVTCATACATTETCVAANTCKKTPVAVAMGDLKFTGLTLAAGGTAFTLSPINTSYQAAGATGIAYPPCAAGAEVSATGGADAATAFSLKAKCVDPLTTTSTPPVPFETGKAAQFTWTPSTASAARVTARIDISHHGGLKGLVMCDVADSGSLQVDASLVTGLIGLGTSGYPVVKLTRINSATANAGSGKATLNIQSMVELPLAVTGVTSCTGNEECPTGQTCADDLKCQ